MAAEVSVILDTCGLLWLAAGGKKLSRAALKEINEAPAVHVSAVSGCEIAMKVRTGKLEISAPVKDWFAQVVEHHGLTVLELDLDACITAAELPAIHDDPFDRFIIAVARHRALTVVTRDERFEKYGVAVIC
jgi:PIN domain nuclease of toxin-antitoxin system